MFVFCVSLQILHFHFNSLYSQVIIHRHWIITIKICLICKDKPDQPFSHLARNKSERGWWIINLIKVLIQLSPINQFCLLVLRLCAIQISIMIIWRKGVSAHFDSFHKIRIKRIWFSLGLTGAVRENIIPTYQKILIELYKGVYPNRASDLLFQNQSQGSYS